MPAHAVGRADRPTPPMTKRPTASSDELTTPAQPEIIACASTAEDASRPAMKHLQAYAAWRPRIRAGRAGPDAGNHPAPSQGCLVERVGGSEGVHGARARQAQAEPRQAPQGWCEMTKRPGIVSYAHRYKRPPRKKQAAPLAGLAVVTTRARVAMLTCAQAGLRLAANGNDWCTMHHLVGGRRHRWVAVWRRILMQGC